MHNCVTTGKEDAAPTQEGEQLINLLSPVSPDYQSPAACIEVQHHSHQAALHQQAWGRYQGCQKTTGIIFWLLRRSLASRHHNHLRSGACVSPAAASCGSPRRLRAGAAPERHHWGALRAQCWGPSRGRLPSTSIPAGLQVLAAASLLSAARSKLSAAFWWSPCCVSTLISCSLLTSEQKLYCSTVHPVVLFIALRSA